MDKDTIYNNSDSVKLIVGLGNPGPEYTETRHNVGFLFLDYLLTTSNFTEEKKFKGEFTKFENKFFLKPTTFMNSSGESVIAISNFYKIKPSEILVVHDDLDLKLGNFKLQFGRGPKVHNGLSSIDKYLGTEDYFRLRIGIENRDELLRSKINPVDYVLGRFNKVELDELSKIFETIINTYTIFKL